MALQTDALTQVLLKYYQRDFPIVSRPFQEIAKSFDNADRFSKLDRFSYSENEVLTKLIELKSHDVLTRIGPIFDHKRAGASLLAAVSVPHEKLNEVAEKINGFAEVNHNYGREHRYNLWFVVTAPNKLHLDQTLSDMEIMTGYPILRLPMVKAYYIDLGFQVSHEKLMPKKPIPSPDFSEAETEAETEAEDSEPVDLLCEIDQHRLRVLIQDGLPLLEQPFKVLADSLGFATEQQVMNSLKSWLKSGLVKRIGLVTNHHQLGYTSNAMVVWDVPDHLIDKAGEQIKQSGLVSLCYQRERSLSEWRYNLYCMIHSRDRVNVLEQVTKLNGLANLASMPSETLFTVRQYKQKGGLYSVEQKPKTSSIPEQNAYQNSNTKQAGMM